MNIVLSPSDVEQIHKAKDILINDLKANITITDLSWQVGMDEKRLKAGFKLEFGTAIKTYVRQYKMERAKELLKEDRSLKVIAKATGYKNEAGLVKAFRKEVGETPVNWKKMQFSKRRNHGHPV